MHVVPTLDVGGMETFVIALARQQQRRGARVIIACQEHLGGLAASAGVPVEVVPTRGNMAYVRNAGLRRWLAALMPDAVHVHTFQWLKIAPYVRVAARDACVVLTQHGLPPFRSRFGLFQMWLAIHAADVVAAVSDEVGEWQRRVLGVPASRQRIIRNGVDADVFRPSGDRAAAKRRLGVPADRFVVGLVARLAAIKNHDMLVEAVRLLHADKQGVHLVLAGDGERREALEKQVEGAGLAECVTMLGEVAVTPETYAAFDVFVLPSDTEGTSISLLEALSCAVPAIASRVGGNVHLLQDGMIGRLVPPRDAAALADAIREVMTCTPCERERIGARARVHVKSHFSIAAAAHEYVRAYGFLRA